jgi:hypothetical protein
MASVALISGPSMVPPLFFFIAQKLCANEDGKELPVIF